MSYFDISNGCTSCSDFSPMAGNGSMNVNSLTQMDPNTQYLANMVASAAASNSSNQVVGGSLNSYPNQRSSEQLSHQSMSNHFNNSNVATNLNRMPNAKPSNKNAQKQRQMVNQKYEMELEADETLALEWDMASTSVTNMQPGYCYLMLGLVIVVALAWNETIRFYINQSIKLNDGSPSYYVAYAIVATLLAFGVYMYMKQT